MRTLAPPVRIIAAVLKSPGSRALILLVAVVYLVVYLGAIRQLLFMPYDLSVVRDSFRPARV